MLTTPLLHPQMLSALAAAGHGSLVLIADGNYPASTALGRNATVVHLNLSPGTVDAVTILTAVVGAVPIEAATVMAPVPDGPYALDQDPPIWSYFAETLDLGAPVVALDPVERMAFYDLAATDEVALVVVSGDTRLYGNILLRIGVRQEQHGSLPSRQPSGSPAREGTDDRWH